MGWREWPYLLSEILSHCNYVVTVKGYPIFANTVSSLQLSKLIVQLWCSKQDILIKSLLCQQNKLEWNIWLLVLTHYFAIITWIRVSLTTFGFASSILQSFNLSLPEEEKLLTSHCCIILSNWTMSYCGCKYLQMRADCGHGSQSYICLHELCFLLFRNQVYIIIK